MWKSFLKWFEQQRWADDLMDWIPDHKRQIWIPIILIAAIVLQRITRHFLRRYIEQSSAKLNTDPTRFKFLRNMSRFLIYGGALVAIIYLIPALKKVALSIFASAGIWAAAIAFASQAAISNIIGGIFLVIFRPIRVNDYVKIGDNQEGIVEDINLRHTTIRSLENRRLIVPNSAMNSATIINNDLVDPRMCRFLYVPISYEANLQQVLDLLQEVCASHPDILDHRTVEQINQGVPKVEIQLTDFAEYYIKARIYIWSPNWRTAFDTCCDLRKDIKLAFDKAGIKMPIALKGWYEEQGYEIQTQTQN